MGAVSPLTPARSRVRGLAGLCIALTALTGAVTRPLRPLLRPFLGARAMRFPTALLSPPVRASRAIAVGGALTRPVAGAARFNTAPPPLSSRRAAPLWAAFLLPCAPHPRRALRRVLGAFLRVPDLCHALCHIPHPVPRLIPRLIRSAVPSRPVGADRRLPLTAQQDKRIYVLFSG